METQEQKTNYRLANIQKAMGANLKRYAEKRAQQEQSIAAIIDPQPSPHVPAIPHPAQETQQHAGGRAARSHARKQEEYDDYEPEEEEYDEPEPEQNHRKSSKSHESHDEIDTVRALKELRRMKEQRLIKKRVKKELAEKEAKKAVASPTPMPAPAPAQAPAIPKARYGRQNSVVQHLSNRIMHAGL